MSIKESREDKILLLINLFTVTLFMLIVIYPLIYVISCSISDPNLVGSGEVWLLPKGITFEGYIRVFQDENIMIGYGNTIFYTFFGTLLDLLLVLTAGYALSKKALPGRAVIMVFLMVTMYFSGGLVPYYMFVKTLGLINTRTILLISGAVSVYNVIIARTFMQSIPSELEEAAVIDGCSTGRLFVQIIIPLSKALIGVMALYYGVAHWNSYFNAMILVTDESKQPLQLFLRRILISEEMSKAMSQVMSDDMLYEKEKLARLLKYSVIIVSSLPVVAIYPFLQKYFDKGVLIGSLKA